MDTPRLLQSLWRFLPHRLASVLKKVILWKDGGLDFPV